MKIALGLGSNLGDRSANLERAVERLQSAGVHVARLSSYYETEPVGPVSDQPPFLNLVLVGTTDLGPRELLAASQRIETDLGRERLVPMGPRTIDIDLLYIDDLVTNDDPSLVIPHPRMHERRFVLVPLREVAADWVHPVLGLTTRELLERTDDTSRVAPFVGSR